MAGQLNKVWFRAIAIAVIQAFLCLETGWAFYFSTSDDWDNSTANSSNTIALSYPDNEEEMQTANASFKKGSWDKGILSDEQITFGGSNDETVTVTRSE